MGTLARYGLVWIFLFAALTGYSQNMRMQSLFTTVAMTNLGGITFSNKTGTGYSAPTPGNVLLFASNNTAYVLTSAGSLIDLGASGGGSGGITNVPTGKIVWVDGVNGSDATGQRGSQMFPFLTMAAAKAASVAGDLEWVRPGFYLGTNITKNLVNIWLDAGAVITNLPITTLPSAHDMINDVGGATTNVIGGFGEFHYLWETNQTSFSSLGAIALGNPATRLWVTGHRMLGRHWGAAGANGSPAVSLGACAYFSITLDEFYDPDIDRQSFDPGDPETEIFSDCTFMIWGNGEVEVDIKRVQTENGYVLWCDGSTALSSG